MSPPRRATDLLRQPFSEESPQALLTSPLKRVEGETLFKMPLPVLLHNNASMEKGWGGEKGKAAGSGVLKIIPLTPCWERLFSHVQTARPKLTAIF